MKLLGGLSARTFLRRHWQKRPLLVRGALPGAGAMLDKRALLALAVRDDAESRIVKRRGARWETAHGPFSGEITLRRNSTLLVSGVNLHLAAADALLRRFAFVPQARLDDLMVSYAETGGGVGPHVDSYDVFLLQGPGRRRWRVWLSNNKIKEYVLAAGDMLYLPPGVKHDGVALEPCFTYSIGFRTPRGAELGAAFLDWLHERGLPDSRYRDPGLRPARRAARIPRELLAHSKRSLDRITWSKRDVERFVGQYLTTPKPHVVFRPGRGRLPLSRARVVLDPKTQLLYSGKLFFINGEALSLDKRNATPLKTLADKRSAPGTALRGLATHILEWHRAGYLHLEKTR
ncbi:MAG TPA: cupin domain-containing protein [Burkholderiales bacterium]